MYASINTFKRHVDLLLMEEGDQSKLIKDFSIYMFNQTLHGDRKNICRYCFQSSGNEQTLERHANHYFEINDKQVIKMA